MKTIILILVSFGAWSQSISDVLPATLLQKGDSIFVGLFMREYEIPEYGYSKILINDKVVFDVEKDDFKLIDRNHNNVTTKTVFICTTKSDEGVLYIGYEDINGADGFYLKVKKEDMQDYKEYHTSLKEKILSHHFVSTP